MSSKRKAPRMLDVNPPQSQPIPFVTLPLAKRIEASTRCAYFLGILQQPSQPRATLPFQAISRNQYQAVSSFVLTQHNQVAVGCADDLLHLTVPDPLILKINGSIGLPHQFPKRRPVCGGCTSWQVQRKGLTPFEHLRLKVGITNRFNRLNAVVFNIASSRVAPTPYALSATRTPFDGTCQHQLCRVNGPILLLSATSTTSRPSLPLSVVSAVICMKPEVGPLAVYRTTHKCDRLVAFRAIHLWFSAGAIARLIPVAIDGIYGVLMRIIARLKRWVRCGRVGRKENDGRPSLSTPSSRHLLV